MSQRPFLVFSAAGDNNRLCKTWFDSTTTRTYDVWIGYYGSRPERRQHYEAKADRVFDKCRGGKFEIFQRIYDAHKATLNQYAYVAVFDDDLGITPAQLNRMFTLASQYKLMLCQPALLGKVSWGITRPVKGVLLRYVNFVEYGCTVFSASALEKVMDTGLPGKLILQIDWLLLQLLGVDPKKPNRNVAIIDATPVYNPFDREKPLKRREINSLVRNRRVAERAKWYAIVREKKFVREWKPRIFSIVHQRAN